MQSAVTLSASEPEPDLAAVRTDPDEYMKHHPRAADVGLVIEVSDSTLGGDRADKGPIYARDNIPFYWIINLVNRQIEVYTSPSGAGTSQGYGNRRDYLVGDAIPLLLEGKTVTNIPVQELLP